MDLYRSPSSSQRTRDSLENTGLLLIPPRLLTKLLKKSAQRPRLVDVLFQSSNLRWKKESQDIRISQSKPSLSETSAGELRTGSSRISSCNSEILSKSDSSRTWRQEDLEDSASLLSQARERLRLLCKQMARSLMEEACPWESQSLNKEESREHQEEIEMSEMLHP